MSQGPTIPESKKMLRQAMKECLQELGPKVRAEASVIIRDQVLASPWWQEARSMALFMSRSDEPDTSALVEAVLKEGRRLLLPRVSGEAMDFYAVTDPSQLLPGTFGLPEPDGLHCHPVPASEIDLMLVPGLAFDRSCHRLGRGKGYFDRFMVLPGFRARRIGVFFGLQETEKIPVEKHDLALDAVVTEKGWVERDT